MRALAAVLLLAAVASAQVTTTTSTTSTTFSKFTAAPTGVIGGWYTRLAYGGSCQGCESGPYHLDGYEMLGVDCDGECSVRLVCRPYGAKHDIEMLALMPADRELHAEMPFACGESYFQVLTCTPTEASPICRVRAWTWE